MEKYMDGELKQRLLYIDDLKVYAELNQDGEIESEFVYYNNTNVPELLIKTDKSTSTITAYKIIVNHLGSVQMVVNTHTGEIVQQMQYDEFGNVTLDTNPGFQPFGFAGGIYDRDTGLTRFGARDYDPVTGSWTSKDPIRFEGGDTNLYRYVLNDSVNLTDPTGNCPWCVAAAIGGIVSGGIDLGVQLFSNSGDLSSVDWESVGTSALVGAATSALMPTGLLLGRGGQRAAQFGYNRSLGLLNRGSTRFGWSGPKSGLDVLSLRRRSRHFDIPFTGFRSGANAIRDGIYSGIIGGGLNSGGANACSL